VTSRPSARKYAAKLMFTQFIWEPHAPYRLLISHADHSGRNDWTRHSRSGATPPPSSKRNGGCIPDTRNGKAPTALAQNQTARAPGQAPRRTTQGKEPAHPNTRQAWQASTAQAATVKRRGAGACAAWPGSAWWRPIPGRRGGSRLRATTGWSGRVRLDQDDSKVSRKIQEMCRRTGRQVVVNSFGSWPMISAGSARTRPGPVRPGW
jgi:hypothetical protein